MRRALIRCPLERNVRGVGSSVRKARSPTHGDLLACRTLREVQNLLVGTLSHVHGAQAANPTTLSSCPSDLAASGNDEGALTAQGGGEGEPHSQSPDTLLGNTDKELNAGAAVTSSSAGAAPVAPCQREPRDLAMEPGLWGT